MLIVNRLGTWRLEELKAKNDGVRSEMKSAQKDLEKAVMDVPPTWTIMATQLADVMKDVLLPMIRNPRVSLSSAFSKSYDYMNSVNSISELKQVCNSLAFPSLRILWDSLGFFGILWDSLGFLGVLEWCLMIEWTIIPHQWCETSISLYVSMPGFFWASKDWDSCCLLYRLISFPLPFQDPFWFAEVLGSYRGLQGCFCDNWWQSSIDPTVSMNGKKHHWLEILSDLQGTFEIWNYLGSPFIQHQCDQWSETSISSISSILPFPESFLDSQEFFERPSSLASNYSEMIQIRTDSKYASRVGRDFSPDSRKSNSLHSKVTFFEALKDTSSYVINCSNNQSEELFRNNPLHQTYHQTSLIQQLQLNLYLVDLIDCINPDMD